MGINSIAGSSWEMLFQGQNASSDTTWGLDQSQGSDLNSRLALVLERRLSRVDKLIEQGQASGQLSDEEAQKLKDMEKEIQDKLQSLQEGNEEASSQDLQDLRQMMGDLNDELRKALPEGRRHALGVASSAQTTADTDSDSGEGGQSQGIDVYA